MSENVVRNAALAVAGGVGAALVGGFLSPVISKSAYAPAVMTGAVGVLALAFRKRLDPHAGYGALAAAGVLAIGAVALTAAKTTATQGNLVGAVRMADIKRSTPNGFLRLEQPVITIHERQIVGGNLETAVAGMTPPATAQAAMWASDHGYADQKLRAIGLR